MSKKFYDIFPPNLKVRSNDSVAERSVIDNRKKITETKKNKIKIISVFLIIFLVFIFNTFFLKVLIQVWPETDLVEYSDSFVVKLDSLYYDVNEKFIPGELIVVEKEESREFDSSGKEIQEKRAEGFLKVYNNYSENSQTLIAETRFISSDGYLFRAVDRVVVPGTTIVQGKTVPGEASVLVRAVEPGEEYNIEKKSNFSIPGLQGTAMYTSIYAENQEPISGGYIGELPKITEQDVESAREVLLSSLLEKSKEEFTKNNPESFYLEESIILNVVEEFVQPESGENYKSFNYRLKTEVLFHSVKKNIFKEYLEKTILLEAEEKGFKDQFNSELKVWDESLIYEYEITNKDLNNNLIELSLKLSAVVYPDLTLVLSKDRMSQVDIDKYIPILEGYNQINKVEISRSPSWIKKFPSAEKIKIETKFDYFLDLNQSFWYSPIVKWVKKRSNTKDRNNHWSIAQCSFQGKIRRGKWDYGPLSWKNENEQN